MRKQLCHGELGSAAVIELEKGKIDPSALAPEQRAA